MMPVRSFTSSFDLHSPRRCAALLLALVALLGCALELGARRVYPRISRLMNRVQTERSAALNLRPEPARPSVLLVGNSLFEIGIDVPLLRTEMPSYDVQRFVISNTWYLDWYYGLRQLFRKGARPDAVVLGLSASQLLAQRIQGDFTAHTLFDTLDLNDIGHALHKNNTDLSSLYFANLSAFYGSRQEVRKWLFSTYIMPDLPQLGQVLRAAPPNRLVSTQQIVENAEPRIRALNELCRKNGVLFILVLPPLPSTTSEEIAAVEEAGRRAGVPVISPIGPTELGPESFPDGMHLNEQGALKFTGSLSSDLKRVLGTRAPEEALHQARARIDAPK